MQGRTEQDSKVPPPAALACPASTPAPRPLRSTRSQARLAPWTPKTSRYTLCVCHFIPALREEAGTAGSAGAAGAGVQEEPSLARGAGALADPEPDRCWAPAAEAPPLSPPPKPRWPHLYAQHRCRRRSRIDPPYPPLPRTSAVFTGGGSAAVFTARNQRNATVSQRFAKNLLAFQLHSIACAVKLHFSALLRQQPCPFVNICSYSWGFSSGYTRSGYQWSGPQLGAPQRAWDRVKPARSQAWSPLFRIDQGFSNCCKLQSAFVSVGYIYCYLL